MTKIYLFCLLLFSLIQISFTRNCDNSEAKNIFTECISSTRKIIFYWTQNDCENKPPATINGVPCDFTCEPGTFLTFHKANRVAYCEKCPSNTYSTGNTLRISEQDGNWLNLPRESSQLCIWVNSDRYWQSEKCDSYIAKNDGSALILNRETLHPKTWNIAEFKLTIYVKKDGYLKYKYRKSSKQENGFINGRLRFFLNFYLADLDEDLTKTTLQEKTIQIPQGVNELLWRYSLNTKEDITDLFFEFNVFFR